MPNHAGTSMCHPEELRALTVGEMAAVQEFPHNWVFSGSATDKCRQIGNAVPPRLGEVAGRVILKLLNAAESLSPTSVSSRTPCRILHLRPHVRTRSYYKNGSVIDGHVGYYEGNNETDKQLCLPLSNDVAASR